MRRGATLHRRQPKQKEKEQFRKMKIIKNAVYCGLCKQVIESKHTHDMCWCAGMHIAVDGGKDYLRRVFNADPEKYLAYEERSITDPPQVDKEKERAGVKF